MACVAPATMRFLRHVSQELQAVPVIHVWYASLPSTLTLLRLDRACGMKLTNAGARMQVRGRLCWERGRGPRAWRRPSQPWLLSCPSGVKNDTVPVAAETL